MQGQLLVARGDAPKMFELVEITLDQIACLITMTIIIARRVPVGSWRYDGLRIACLNVLNQGVTVVALIPEHGLSIRCFIQQLSGLSNVRTLRSGQREANGVAERIDEAVDFGTESAPRTTQSLRAVFSPGSATNSRRY